MTMFLLGLLTGITGTFTAGIIYAIRVNRRNP